MKAVTAKGLAALPTELLQRIISFLDDQSDLWRFSQTCQALSDICQEYFQTSFSNLRENHQDPTSKALQKLVQSNRATPAIKGNIKTVEVRSLRMSSYIWLCQSISALEHFSYIHTYDSELSQAHRLYMDHLMAPLQKLHRSTLKTLHLSILDPSTDLDYLQQQFWGTPHIPSLQHFTALQELTIDQTYFLATVGVDGQGPQGRGDVIAQRQFLPSNLKLFTVLKCTDTLAEAVPRLATVIASHEILRAVNLLLARQGRENTPELSRALWRKFDILLDPNGNPEGWKIMRKNAVADGALQTGCVLV